MNNTIKSLTLGLLMLSTGLAACAQDEAPAPVQQNIPRWVSAKGYWMVETNPADPKHTCIYFYTNVNVLVFKETIDGTNLALNTTRTKMRLKKALEQLLRAWEAGEPLDKKTPVLAAILKKEPRTR